MLILIPDNRLLVKQFAICDLRLELSGFQKPTICFRSWAYIHLSFTTISFFSLMLSLSFSESADPLHIRAEAGGNVTFRCPADEKRRPAFFYFQIGHIFVNGYYASKNINTSWENTRVEPNRTHVHMYRLNISHSGDYLCIIQYNGSNTITEVPIKLTVTGTSVKQWHNNYFRYKFFFLLYCLTT